MFSTYSDSFRRCSYVHSGSYRRCSYVYIQTNLTYFCFRSRHLSSCWKSSKSNLQFKSNSHVTYFFNIIYDSGEFCLWKFYWSPETLYSTLQTSFPPLKILAQYLYLWHGIRGIGYKYYCEIFHFSFVISCLRGRCILICQINLYLFLRNSFHARQPFKILNYLICSSAFNFIH